MGTQKTQSRILECFVWPSLTTDVNNLVGLLLFIIIFMMHLVECIINPRRACAGGLRYLSCMCVCLCVCLSETLIWGLGLVEV